ncbi:MAG: hypothetical protein RL572_1342, partial [Pseudomonadota bacterium]
MKTTVDYTSHAAEFTLPPSPLRRQL